MSNIQKYGGTWKLFEKEELYQGELHINYDNNVIVLEMLIPANKNEPMPRPPYKGRIPYICGTLFSGVKVVLYDCYTGKEHSHVMSHTQQIIYADYAFWGLHISSQDELKFTKALFDFGEIIEWSDLCNYEWEFTDDGCSNLVWHHKEPVKFQLNNNLEIAFYANQGKIGGNMYGKELKANQHIHTEFEYKTPMTWESIMEDVLCVQYLIGLGINQKVEVYKAQYYHSSIYIELTNNETPRKIPRATDMTLGTGKIEHTKNSNRYDYLYTLSDLKENDAFTKWKENYFILKPVLDLYFTAFSNTAGTPEMLFLNLMQALETYHARFITDSAKEYSDRVDNLIDDFCQGSGERWKKFLLNKEQKGSTRIYLRSRLADLVFANGNFPFFPNGYQLEEYIQKIVDTRNYYTHYNPTKFKKAFSKEELIWINGHLLGLLEYHLLTLIGFNTDEVRKKVVQKIKRIDESYKMQNHTHDIKS